MRLNISAELVRIHPTAYIAPTAVLIGDVTIGPEASVWYGAVLRGDSAPIIVGARSNVQDGCILHVDPSAGVTLGEGVTLGHGAIVHAAAVGNNVLVGMRATVLDGAVISEDCIIGAGAVVTPGMIVPARSLVVGVPGKVVRSLTLEEIEWVRTRAEHYVNYARVYRGQAAKQR